MKHERWKKVDKLANQALDLETAERESFLENAADASPSLANDARLILKAVQDAEGFLESPLQVENGTAVQTQPKVIGNYRVLEKLGEGGMGIVYLVEQLPPIRRKLALKVVRHGIGNKEAIARFASEHQALAYMDHPYVAHIYDSDLSDDGQPFFTMEYLPGLAITDYCRTHQLSLQERLLLFVKVCEGVQHAHQRGIIHRDLKPSNIMVVEHDDVPIPKIIDFGIAKAVSGISLTNLTLYTERGVIMGTPSYMSPEQADVRAGDIDTRTDVYALGAILYELLCGTPPYDPIRLRDASLSEILRIICKEEPRPPSSNFGDHPNEEPIYEAIPNHTLSRTLRGELDWITMRALEKERSRRYNSAIDLADDIRRYLENQPVSASPPSRIYLTRKFLYRNRSTVFSVGVCLLALTVMLVTWFFSRQKTVALINEKNSVLQQVDSLQVEIGRFSAATKTPCLRLWSTLVDS